MKLHSPIMKLPLLVHIWSLVFPGANAVVVKPATSTHTASCPGGADLDFNADVEASSHLDSSSLANISISLARAKTGWPYGSTLPPHQYDSGRWASASQLVQACRDPRRVCDPEGILTKKGGAAKVQYTLDQFHRSLRVSCKGREIPFNLAVAVVPGLQRDSYVSHMKEFGEALVKEWGLHRHPDCPAGAVILLMTARRYVVFRHELPGEGCNRYLARGKDQEIVDPMKHHFKYGDWAEGLISGIETAEGMIDSVFHRPAFPGFLCMTLVTCLILTCCCGFFFCAPSGNGRGGYHDSSGVYHSSSFGGGGGGGCGGGGGGCGGGF